MGVGLDPHSYVPTPSDIRLLQSADHIYAMGLDLEASMHDLLLSLSSSTNVAFIGEDLDKEDLIPADDSNKAYDPHVWFDIDLFLNLVDIVSEDLISKHPEFSDEIISNTKTYQLSLNNLKNYTQSRIDLLPLDKRFLITAHDAFSYFANKYDFQLHTLQGVSTVSDYSLKDVNDLVNLILDNNVNAIFTESSVSNQSINTIFEKVSSKNKLFKIGGQLYSDSLGEVGSQYESYVGSFMHNVDTIVDNLK